MMDYKEKALQLAKDILNDVDNKDIQAINVHPTVYDDGSKSISIDIDYTEVGTKDSDQSTD